MGTRVAGLFVDLTFATVIVLATLGALARLRPGAPPQSPLGWLTGVVCFALVVLALAGWERRLGSSLGKLLLNLAASRRYVLRLGRVGRCRD